MDIIALCLQCCPLDLDQTFDLVNLICDLEHERRPETSFFLVYRKDVPLWVSKEFQKIANKKFGTVQACQARNHDVGWPGGSNMLAASAMMEMAILQRCMVCQNEAYLLFEPDCVPLSIDWMDRLTLEWERAKGMGKEAFGHWNMPGSLPENLHMNGNAVFATGFWERHPDMVIGAATQGWDYFYREKYIPLSCDSPIMEQYYNAPHVELEQLQSLRDNGKVFLHGVKDSSARTGVRTMLLSHVSA